MYIVLGGLDICNFENISPNAILEAENSATTPQKLAVNLLTTMFTHDQLATGNCTKPSRDDIVLLDQLKIQAIRGEVHTICIKQVNIVCSMQHMLNQYIPLRPSIPIASLARAEPHLKGAV